MRTTKPSYPIFAAAAAVLILAGPISGAQVDFPVDVPDGADPVRAQWTGPVAVGRSRDTATGVLTLSRTAVGAFAEARLDPSPAWATARTLEIVVNVDNPGVFSAKLIEADGVGAEGWTARADLDPGVHALRWRLERAPDGVLQPATPRGDGRWNPGSTGIRGLRLGFSGGPAQIRSIRLVGAPRD